MTTETTIKENEICNTYRKITGYKNTPPIIVEFARAIEQAVQQSPEIQALRKDAARYRWLKQRMLGVDFEYGEPKCIALTFSMPGRDVVFSADCDANIDLGMRTEP